MTPADPSAAAAPAVESLLAAARRGDVAAWTVRELIRLGETAFNRAGVNCRHSMGTPMQEARFLAYWSLGLHHFDDAYLDVRPTTAEAAAVFDLFERRIGTRQPAAYLTGEAFLEGYWFWIDHDVFVPRTPLVRHLGAALERAGTRAPRALDLGCGCGSNGIIVAQRSPRARVELTDVSTAAVDVAKRNIDRYQVGDRVRAYVSDLFDQCSGPYDIVISNPPHVPSATVAGGAPEVRAEPRAAWDGGSDGLDLVRRILHDTPRHLRAGGVLLVDVGAIGRREIDAREPAAAVEWLPGRNEQPGSVLLLTAPWEHPLL